MAIDPVWEQVFTTRPWGKYPPEAVIRGVMRTQGSAPDRKTRKILDLGTGPGANTWFLAREGFMVAGIDGSPTAITQCQERLTAEGMSADLHIGDITAALPWSAGSFDMVLDNASLCSNSRSAIRTALGHIRTVLKPGGYLLSLSFTDATWGYGLGKPADELGAYIGIDAGPLAGIGYIQFLSRKDIDTLFSDFDHVSIERTSYTLDGGQHQIELWVVLCRKPEV